MRFEATPHRNVFEKKENLVHIKVEVEPDKMSDKKERAAINLASVVDRSGSMSGTPLENAKEVQKYLVKNMTTEDQIAIIEFGSDSKVAVPMNKTSAKEKIYRLIDQIQTSGMTNISAALLDAVDEMRKVKDSQGINRIILLSDGQANEGITGDALVHRMKKEIDEEGMTLSAFGLGENYDVNLLSKLAEAGNGAFYHVANPDDIHKFYAEEFGDILNVVLTRGKVYVQEDSNARVERMYGYELEDGQYWKVGSFYEDETREFLIEMRLTEEDLDRPITIAFEAETSDGTVVVVNSVVTISSGTKEESDASENLEVCKFADEICQAFFIKEANKQRDAGNWTKAKDVLNSMVSHHSFEDYSSAGVADDQWVAMNTSVLNDATEYYSGNASKGMQSRGLFAAAGESYLSTRLFGRGRKSKARAMEMVEDKEKETKPRSMTL